MSSNLAPGRPSTALDRFYVPSAPATPVGLEKAAYTLLHRSPESEHDFDALGSRLAKAIKRKKSYDGYYIESVWKGRNPMTKPLAKAIENLIAELQAVPADQDYHEVTVLVLNGVHVPDGTVIMRDAKTCICGVSFIPTIWNQINHTRACAFMRMKKRLGK